MHACITDRDVYLGVTVVADEAFATSVEEWLRVLRLRPGLEDLLVIKDDSAVCGGEVVALLLLITG